MLGTAHRQPCQGYCQKASIDCIVGSLGSILQRIKALHLKYDHIMGRIADESDFLELLIANERVAKLLDGVTSSFNGPRYVITASVSTIMP